MSLKENVELALEDIRPALVAHGGDVRLIDVTEDGIVEVELEGQCKGCAMSQMTLTMGIERQLKEQFPEIKEVRNVVAA
jgi:Fe-S cluster biogenesis protein NfuA